MGSTRFSFALETSLFDGFSWDSGIPSAFVADQTASPCTEDVFQQLFAQMSNVLTPQCGEQAPVFGAGDFDPSQWSVPDLEFDLTPASLGYPPSPLDSTIPTSAASSTNWAFSLPGFSPSPVSPLAQLRFDSSPTPEWCQELIAFTPSPAYIPEYLPAPTHFTPSLFYAPASWAPTGQTVTCRWNNCGALIDAASVTEHISFAHRGEITSKTKTVQRCLWVDCTHESTDIQRHARLHYGVEVMCDQCGDAFSRQDAVVRHKRRGSCKQCKHCKTTFGSIEEKIVHGLVCAQRGCGVASGRPREVAKIGSARTTVHPYLFC